MPGKIKIAEGSWTGYRLLSLGGIDRQPLMLRIKRARAIRACINIFMPPACLVLAVRRAVCRRPASQILPTP